VANRSTQSGIVGRIAFWVLGGAFFLSLGVLPGWLLGWKYLTGGVVHMRLVPAAIILFLLLWLVSAFPGGKPSSKQPS